MLRFFAFVLAMQPKCAINQKFVTLFRYDQMIHSRNSNMNKLQAHTHIYTYQGISICGHANLLVAGNVNLSKFIELSRGLSELVSKLCKSSFAELKYKFVKWQTANWMKWA